MTVEEKVKEIIARLANVGPETVKDDSGFVDDLDMDLSDMVDLQIELEEEFEIVISDEVREEIFVKVLDVIDYVKQNEEGYEE